MLKLSLKGFELSDIGNTRKTGQAPIPEGGMALVLRPVRASDDYVFMEMDMFHNFKNEPKDLTKDDKTVFLIAQGILTMCHEHGDFVLEQGNEVMRKFLKGLGAEEEPVGLADLTPKGSC